jgi:hypothetical protein
MQDIAQRQIARLQGHALDGLVLYDIQDEAERTAQDHLPGGGQIFAPSDAAVF